MDLTERTLSRQEVYQGRIVGVHVDQVSLPNGKTARREIVTHPGGVAILALDDKRRAAVVRQKLMESRPGGMKALAGEILTDAAARAGWEDDMTVLALSLERRRA